MAQREEARLRNLLGGSPALGRAREFVRAAARVNVPVLILGETGTGKSLLARIIHNESSRAAGPFLSINCAGVPESLFESEFFGHRRGAFTGARDGRRGLLEQAHGGSLLLDEIGELSVSQQAKLLTCLEEGEIRPLGAEGTVRIDVRILAATSRSLRQGLEAGDFRRDLFHRLAVLTCHLPPLRARREDIPLLARRLLAGHQRRHGYPPVPLPADAVAFLQEQAWPGNVRELSHLLEASLILCEGAALSRAIMEAALAVGEDLPPEGSRSSPAQGSGPAPYRAPSGERIRREGEEATVGEGGREGNGGRPAVRGGAVGTSARYSFLGTAEEERAVIEASLRRWRGNKTRVARELGMARNTLRRKLRRYDLE